MHPDGYWLLAGGDLLLSAVEGERHAIGALQRPARAFRTHRYLEPLTLIVYYYGGTTPVNRQFTGRYPFNLWAAKGYVVYVLQPRPWKTPSS